MKVRLLLTVAGLAISFALPTFATAKRELNMMKRMIYSKILLVGVMVVFTCFGHAAEPLKIGMVAPLTGAAAEVGRYQLRAQISLLKK